MFSIFLSNLLSSFINLSLNSFNSINSLIIYLIPLFSFLHNIHFSNISPLNHPL